jgi:DNA-binding protein HU-beta
MAKPMTKAEIADRLADRAGITKKQAQAVLDGFLEQTYLSLRNGRSVALGGFGKFVVEKKGGRKRKSGAAAKIPATNVVKFRVGRAAGGALS